MPYANNKYADQPAHSRSLISAFVVRCLDSLIPLVSISKISSLYLASVAAQAGLSLTLSQTPEDRFSRGMAQITDTGLYCLAGSVCPRPKEHYGKYKRNSSHL